MDDKELRTNIHTDYLAVKTFLFITFIYPCSGPKTRTLSNIKRTTISDCEKQHYVKNWFHLKYWVRNATDAYIGISTGVVAQIRSHIINLLHSE